MEQSKEIEFKVDEQYENEKGVFKVVSIQKDQMVIRWEDGEETRTDIELQRRIAERRQWEEFKRLENAHAAQEARRKSASKSPKRPFAGLAATDFKTSGYRTTWRSRDQLGGAVVAKIKTHQFELNSWAFGSQPEMHVLDVRHRDAASPADPPRFFVRIDDRFVHYGLRVTHPDHSGGESTGWPALCEWLRREENEQAVQAIAVHHHLSACNRAHPAACIRAAADDAGWHTEEDGQPSAEASLPAYFDSGTPAEPLEFELFASLAKDDALACGPDIAARIAQLFADLLPLYEAAASASLIERPKERRT